MINIKDNLELVLTIVGLIGIVFRIAQVKADIESSIDKVKDDLKDEIRFISTTLQVGQAKSEAKKEMIEYYLNDLYYQIDHKFIRAWEEIKELQKFLQKDGFIIRAKTYTPPPERAKIKIDGV
ncbi:hypothetical protein I8748_16540 [Nostoc sp. CENA67]|uniref:Uncharacterized protein n=1 Tax=Amazonocrinis nigriterrae CENA67 TaxID=2794033 RepID=A0A8J7HUT6_9NOST|nr:hypothetical protein [Amazonocrinis nigriterrae]MBH8563780.1 hypothetical protein [Amazonocrinis nigriterrae CENA67]